MKKKVVLVCICSVLVLIAVIAVGLNAVFSVGTVRVNFTLYSDRAREESASLQKDLDRFVGSSTTFLDLEEVRGAVEEYPYFRLDSVEKQYPQTIVVTVSERQETFAYENADGAFSLLDKEGFCLGTNTDGANRADGLANILLRGFTLTAAAGETVSGDYFAEWLTVYNVWAQTLGNVRMNVVSVELARPTTSSADDYFTVMMSEGVKVTIKNPSSLTEEKARAALSKYTELLDEDKMFGEIYVSESILTGEVTATYTPRNLGDG